MNKHLSKPKTLSKHQVLTEIQRCNPETPKLLFAPKAIFNQVELFQRNFDGTVLFATKANPKNQVLQCMSQAGITAFDVAGLNEIKRVRLLDPLAELHYNNPIRSRTEIIDALKYGVRSFAIDRANELQKLAELLDAEEIGETTVTIRFKLRSEGAVYDFGEKFGATVKDAESLIGKAQSIGFKIGLSFHVGTQCNNGDAWAEHIRMAALILQNSQCQSLELLNVGGGFPSYRTDEVPLVKQILQTINSEFSKNFDDDTKLICEPGRALVADAFSLVACIKSRPSAEEIFLNDGIYGTLSELLLVGLATRVDILTPDGEFRHSPRKKFTVFGPTCDSVDVFPDKLLLPEDCAEGDFAVFHGLGAYSTSTSTFFNGYGHYEIQQVADLNFGQNCEH